jgi:hypothetical protein
MAQPNGNCKARSSGTQRVLFTSPRRTRRNRGVQGTQQLGCKKNICGCELSIIKTEFFGVHRGVFLLGTTLLNGCGIIVN